jgi:hypothetical protein
MARKSLIMRFYRLDIYDAFWRGFRGRTANWTDQSGQAEALLLNVETRPQISPAICQSLGLFKTAND